VEVAVPVPEPYPVVVEKKVPVPEPYSVEVLVPVPSPQPYPVLVEKEVLVPEPYTVEVPVPYPVHAQQHVALAVEKDIACPLEVDTPLPYRLDLLASPALAAQVHPNAFTPHLFEKVVPLNIERNFGIDVDRYYSNPSLQSFAVDVEKVIPYAIEKVGHYDIEAPFASFYPSHVNPLAYSVEEEGGFFYPDFAYKAHPHVLHIQ
jgi:hypothetical protein